MKTFTKYPRSLVADDKKFLTSFNPVIKQSFFPDKCFELFPKKDKQGIKVFIVDDDLMYLTDIRCYLSIEIPSLNLKTFQTGESFLLDLGEHPDVVILDYYLDSQDSSAQNGISILMKIKNLYPHTKVIMLSYQDEINIAMECIKHGAFDYVSKGQTAFVRIKNILMNIEGNMSVIGKVKKQINLFKIINLLILIILILFYLLSHKL